MYQIEVDISNEVQFETIVSNLNITPLNITNFKFSLDKNKIEQKIFKLKNNNFDIFEIEDDYILFKINKTEQRNPDINDEQTKNEISFLRKKLRKLKKILSTNVEIWDETQHDPVEEFKLLIKLIDEKN